MPTLWQQLQPRVPSLPGNVYGAGNGYIPHPAPNAAGNENEKAASKMASTWAFIKALVIPAIISLLLYFLISYAIVPLWKRYRGKYSNYLPLDRISTHTTSLRERVQTALIGLLLPSSWRRDFGRHTVSAQDGSGSEFDEDEGEELFDVDENRRAALSLDARRGLDDEGRRLSRDLEEGFKDDSDEEEATVTSR